MDTGSIYLLPVFFVLLCVVAILWWICEVDVLYCVVLFCFVEPSFGCDFMKLTK